MPRDFAMKPAGQRLYRWQMADNSGEVGTDGAAHEHAATYARFMAAMKWGVVAIAVLLIVLAVLLVDRT